jgi:hypothetical protein
MVMLGWEMTSLMGLSQKWGLGIPRWAKEERKCEDNIVLEAVC